MVSRGVWLVAAFLLGCAGKPPAQQAAAMPDEPPPKGAPQPRLGALPPPPPARASETIDENERRFPINEHRLRQERARRAAMQVSGRVEVKTDNPHACDGLPPEEKTECPLRDPKAVLSIGDLPKGVRVSLRAGTVSPERLQQALACHLSLAGTRPQAPTPCPYLDPRTEAEVTVHDGRIDVDLEHPSEADRLRRQVRTALGAKK
jgi:hypothetical protein